VTGRTEGCRNILVHQYGNVLDDLVYETISTRLGDFAEFRRQILAALPA